MKFDRSVINADYPALIIDDTTIKNVKEHPQHYRGHIRTALGRVYTNESYEKRSVMLLNKKLP